MKTITISTGDGRTITSSSVIELRDTVCGWWPAMPGQETAFWMKRLFDSIRKGHMMKAGNAAFMLDLKFAFAPGTARTADPYAEVQATALRDYLVPEDPASLTDCEACQ